MKPFITICINTYKRNKELMQCLDSIYSQKNYNIYKKRIEILVLNDDVSKPLNGLQKKYKNRFILLQPKKRIGMVKGYMRMFDFAHGEYLWTMSDDDILTSRSLKVVFHYLDRFSPDRLLGNVNQVDIQDNRVRIVKRNCLNLSENICIRTQKELFLFLQRKFLYDVDWYTYAMSSNIFKKKIYINNRTIIPHYNGYSLFSFPQTALFYYSTNSIKSLFIQEVIVNFRVNNFSWLHTTPIKTAWEYNKCANYFWDVTTMINSVNINFTLRILILVRKVLRVGGILQLIITSLYFAAVGKIKLSV